MDKIHLNLLIPLLMLFTFFAGCSLSRVESGIAQIENETSAIKKELAGLKSSLDDKIQKLDADIQKNGSQIDKETSAIKEKLYGLESNLSTQVQKLNTGVQTNNSLFRNETSTIKKQLDDIKSSLSDQIQKLNTDILSSSSRNEKEISAITKEVGISKSSLSGQIQKLNTDIQENDNQLGNRISALDDNVQKLNAGVHAMKKQQLYWTIAILVLFIIITSTFFFLRHRIIRLGNTLSSELNSSLEKLQNELFQMDTKPAMGLDQELESDNLQLGQETEPDHSLPIKVCEEIQRMRNRMKHMDQNDQATKVFRKRLESLEETLNERGYEMVNLEGKPFIEGMTVNAQFIPDENLKDGERIISRVIKPQINYKDILIQAAEIEVNQGV